LASNVNQIYTDSTHRLNSKIYYLLDDYAH